MKKYAYLIFFTVGCYSVKKATKQLNKAYDTYPEIVAKKTSQWYPCLPYAYKVDSSQYKNWFKSFDSLNNLYLGYLSLPQDTIYQSVHDTVTGKCLDKKAVIQYRDVIRKMPAIHDTVYRVDSSKNYLIYKDKQDCENDRLKILNNYLKFKNYLIALLVALLISVCLNIIQYKTKK